MNKILINTVFMIIAVIVFAVLGNLVLLTSLNIEIKQKEEELIRKNSEVKLLEDSIKSVASDSYRIRENILLNIGQEGQLMSLFINESLHKIFMVKSYDLYNTYYYKPDDYGSDMEVYSSANQNDNSTKNSEGQDNDTNGSQSGDEKLSNLDENGMPQDAYVDEGSEDNWEGLNILPIKITFSIKKENLTKILKYFQDFPVNTIRAADFVFAENDLVTGTLVFTFPLNEEKN